LILLVAGSLASQSENTPHSPANDNLPQPTDQDEFPSTAWFLQNIDNEDALLKENTDAKDETPDKSHKANQAAVNEQILKEVSTMPTTDELKELLADKDVKNALYDIMACFNAGIGVAAETARLAETKMLLERTELLIFLNEKCDVGKPQLALTLIRVFQALSGNKNVQKPTEEEIKKLIASPKANLLFVAGAACAELEEALASLGTNVVGLLIASASLGQTVAEQQQCDIATHRRAMTLMSMFATLPTGAQAELKQGTRDRLQIAYPFGSSSESDD